jgi:hypothetical protein
MGQSQTRFFATCNLYSTFGIGLVPNGWLQVLFLIQMETVNSPELQKLMSWALEPRRL